MKTIYDIHPQKIYHANIDKNESFHLETLEEATRTAKINSSPDVSKTYETIEHGEWGQSKYVSNMKKLWYGSPTYSKEFNNPAFKEIFDFIEQCANEYLLELHVDTNLYQVKLTSAYLNCDKNNEGSGAHNHRGSFLSFSYYFHLRGDVQPLTFLNPTQQDEFFFPFGICTSRAFAEFTPSIGDVLFFPSYLFHAVPPLMDSPIEENMERWLFNGDFHIFSNEVPNLPDKI